MMRQFASRQFLLFLATGGTAAAVNFGSRILYSRWYSFGVAVILAYITGMITAYVLARLFVYTNSRQSAHRSVLFFILVNVVAALQTFCVSVALADYVLPMLGVVKFAREIAHGFGVIVPVFTSYIGHKRWSFREI